MFTRKSKCQLLSLPVASFLIFSAPSISATTQRPSPPHSTITEAIDLTRTVAIQGNVRGAANAQNDRGQVEDSLPLEHMQLLLKRTPEKEQELNQYIDQLHTKGSPDFHKWLTQAELQERFGPTAEDVAKVSGWLTASGFTVNNVLTAGLIIDFSGTAGTVRAALHTSIHNLNVGGVAHIANMKDPEIPAALAGVVAGVVSLHDFKPHMMHHNVSAAHVDPKTGNIIRGESANPNYTFPSGGATYEAVVPGDLATIYNLNPAFQAGYSGQGQTIVVIEDTNVYSTADWTTFRSTFGLSSYTSGSFTQVHPGTGCTNPGVVSGAEGEAILDAEWASAGAPSAAIMLASCADTRTTFGGLIALENLIAESSPPKIVSISYGECEAENGATANAAFNSTYQTAVTAGISVFVASGDEGAASCDADLTKSTHGIGVSGFASTPYNVAVGGTDFGDTYAGISSNYWNATNTSTYASAKSYIPEIPWNDSCASSLLASYNGYSATYGSSGFCNSSTGEADYLTTGSGSGGPSGCATGSPSVTGVVGGTCKGYAKPSWQSVTGVPADGVRDIPDVSLFAANGVWGHYYVYCDSDTGDGGAACTGAPSGWSGAGGTSFASPIMAAIQSLINQYKGSAQGNPNPRLYSLAAYQYANGGLTACNADTGSGPASACIFNDVTVGDMDVNCTGTNSCYKPSGTNGVLSTSTTAYKPAYGTGAGWDFASGVGSINTVNLILNW